MSSQLLFVVLSGRSAGHLSPHLSSLRWKLSLVSVVAAHVLQFVDSYYSPEADKRELANPALAIHCCCCSRGLKSKCVYYDVFELGGKAPRLCGGDEK